MSPRPRVLVSAPYAMPIIEEYKRILKAAGCDVVVAKVRERLEEDELLKVVGDVDGIICGDDKITARVLDAAPRLKVISKWGTGIDSIDQKAAAARGVLVKNTPNAFSEGVADTAFAAMLSFARKPDLQTRAIKAGRWEKPPLFILGEKTLGIVGVGNCGKASLRRALAFGMRVLGTDPKPVKAAGIELVSFKTLLKESDFITLHCDLNPTSFHLMDDAAFSLMKKTAFLVNTSRGPVVDEKALVRALKAKKIAGAGLDVYEDEPLPTRSALRKFDNVILTAHNANSSPRLHKHVHDNTIKNLLEVLCKR
jgi:D-3-phosphoglycerate dehydrogenase / 2-oxoglutarate reductase